MKNVEVLIKYGGEEVFKYNDCQAGDVIRIRIDPKTEMLYVWTPYRRHHMPLVLPFKMATVELPQ